MNEPFSSLPVRIRAFTVAALLLCGASVGASLMAITDGDQTTALLGATVAVFAAWMASAIVQFHRRMSSIDQVVDEAKRRIEHSERVIGEVRRLADRVRNDDSRSEDQTVH